MRAEWWALALTVLGVVAALERMASPPWLCRLGLHVRPALSTGARWVCSRCPTLHGAQAQGVDNEG